MKKIIPFLFLVLFVSCGKPMIDKGDKNSGNCGQDKICNFSIVSLNPTKIAFDLKEDNFTGVMSLDYKLDSSGQRENFVYVVCQGGYCMGDNTADTTLYSYGQGGILVESGFLMTPLTQTEAGSLEIKIMCEGGQCIDTFNQCLNSNANLSTCL